MIASSKKFRLLISKFNEAMGNYIFLERRGQGGIYDL